jgi:hypothetical protein
MRVLGLTTVRVVLLIGGFACARNSGGLVVARPENPIARDSITITVINDHWYDARVHAVYGGGLRYPLGVIGNKREGGPFVIPWHVDDLIMEIDFVVERGRYGSDRVLVEPPNISSSGFFAPIPQ